MGRKNTGTYLFGLAVHSGGSWRRPDNPMDSKSIVQRDLPHVSGPHSHRSLLIHLIASLPGRVRMRPERRRGSPSGDGARQRPIHSYTRKHPPSTSEAPSAVSLVDVEYGSINSARQCLLMSTTVSVCPTPPRSGSLPYSFHSRLWHSTSGSSGEPVSFSFVFLLRGESLNI
jgi:hypothetical protein